MNDFRKMVPEHFPKLLNKNNISEFLNSIDNVMTDCDGVLWTANKVIPGSNDVLNKLRSLGKRVFYITNNSTKSRETLVLKCENLGFVTKKDEAISTSFIVAQYLKQLQFQKKVYILGSSGIANELDIVGIKHIGVGPDPCPENIMDMEYTITLDPEVGAVVVGFDEFFNLSKIMRASSYLLNPDCLFIATNKDEKFPITKKNLIFPGTGVLVNAIETATDRTPEVMGKPNERMFNVLRDKFNLEPKRTVMIGDRCSTDILLGKNCGLQTLLVLSGVNSFEDLLKWSHSSDSADHRLLPDYYLPCLGDMDPLLV